MTTLGEVFWAPRALWFALAAYSFGFVCGQLSRNWRRSEQIRKLEADRAAWQTAAFALHTRARRYRRERDQRCAILPGFFRARPVERAQ